MSTGNEAPATWLSQDAFDRLQAELDELIANRPVIAAEINARREEGDLRENGGYHAAREEQGKAEGRILYLKELLRTAKVGGAPTADVVSPGMVVTIYFDDDKDDTETFPARLPGDRVDHRADGLQPRVGAGPGDPGRSGRPDLHLHRPQRGRHQGDRGQLRAVLRLSPRRPPGLNRAGGTAARLGVDRAARPPGHRPRPGADEQPGQVATTNDAA